MPVSDRSDTMEQFLRCMLMPDTAIEAQVNTCSRIYGSMFFFLLWPGGGDCQHYYKCQVVFYGVIGSVVVAALRYLA